MSKTDVLVDNDVNAHSQSWLFLEGGNAGSLAEMKIGKYMKLHDDRLKARK